MCAGVGNEDAPSVEVGAIEHDLVMDLACSRQGGGHVPTPLCAPGEGACAGGEVAPVTGTRQPGHEAGELGSSSDISPGLRRRGAAVLAPPPGPSSSGLAVLNELVRTYTTAGMIPGIGH